MKKQILIIGIIISIVLIGLYIYNDQIKNTTYNSVLKELISENESAEELEIENTREHTVFRTENKDIINKILNPSSDVELKMQSKIPSIDFIITIYTNKNSYEIFLGKKNVHIIDAGQYQIKGNNSIYQFIKTSDFNWNSQ